MLYGIGVDVTGLARFEAKQPGGHFTARVCGPQEQEELARLGPRRCTQRLAGCWAAKEAFLKAAGRGLGGFALGEIQLLHRASGQPYLHLTGGAAAWARGLGLTAQVSVSHDAGVCTAFVVLEQSDRERET